MYSLHYIIPIVIFYLFIRKNKTYLVHEGKINFFKNLFKPIKNFPNKIQVKLTKARLMFWGLVLGNLIDLDHLYYRIIGKVSWTDSHCQTFFMKCSSIGFYPFHKVYFIFIFMALSSLVFFKKKEIKFLGWLAFGAFLNLILDMIQYIIGFGI